MGKEYITNNTASTMHCGSVMVMPGATRLVDSCFVNKPKPTFQPTEFLSHPAKDVITAIFDLDPDRLRLVLAAENDGKNRSTVINAIEIELAKQVFCLSPELAGYKVSIASFPEDELRGELLIQADCPGKLRLVQDELAERASA